MVDGDFFVFVGVHVHTRGVNHRVSPALTPATDRVHDVQGQELTPLILSVINGRWAVTHCTIVDDGILFTIIEGLLHG